MATPKYKIGDVMVNENCLTNLSKEKVIYNREYIKTEFRIIELVCEYVFVLKDVKVNTYISETYASEDKWYNEWQLRYKTPEKHVSKNNIIWIYECIDVRELWPVDVSIREFNERHFSNTYPKA